jgi:hypothetical protein
VNGKKCYKGNNIIFPGSKIQVLNWDPINQGYFCKMNLVKSKNEKSNKQDIWKDIAWYKPPFHLIIDYKIGYIKVLKKPSNYILPNALTPLYNKFGS